MCIHFLETPCIFIQRAGFKLQMEHVWFISATLLGSESSGDISEEILLHITGENRIQIYILKE